MVETRAATVMGTQMGLIQRMLEMRLLWLVVALALLSSGQASASTFNWGPFDLNFGLKLGLEFTDNDNNSEKNPQSNFDLTFGPTVSGSIRLPFTLRGGQRLELATSVSASLQYSLDDGWTDSAGSPISVNLALPLYIGHWYTVAQNNFRFTNDPLESTLGYGEDNIEQFNNTASLSTTRQFGRYSLGLGGQRADDWYPDRPNEDETRWNFYVTPSYYFQENYSVFLSATYGFNEYSDSERRESAGISLSIGLSGQIMQSLSGSISVGYAVTDIEAGRTNDAERVDGVTSSIGLSYAHPLRPNTTHGISFSRSPGITAILEDSDLTEVTGISYTISHLLSREITLTPSIGWFHAEDIGGSTGEIVDTIDIGFGLSKRFTRQLSGSMNYRFQSRSSNLKGQSYDTNRINISLTYTF
jgi:hypothetical protein